MLKAPRAAESTASMVDRVRSLAPAKALVNVRNTVLAAVAALGLSNASCTTENPWLIDCSEEPGRCDFDEDGFNGDEECDDADAEVNPDAAEEACDGVDQNCDGDDLTDEDGDGFSGCEDGTDCDDNNPTIHTGAPETACDGVDADCDRNTMDPEEGAPLWGLDLDGDGYYANPLIQSCTEPASEVLPDGTVITWVWEGGDCDDQNNESYPGTEDCPQ